MRTLEEVEKDIGELIFKLRNLGNEIETKEKEINTLKALSIPLEAKMRKLNDEFHEILAVKNDV